MSKVIEIITEVDSAKIVLSKIIAWQKIESAGIFTLVVFIDEYPRKFSFNFSSQSFRDNAESSISKAVDSLED